MTLLLAIRAGLLMPMMLPMRLLYLVATLLLGMLPSGRLLLLIVPATIAA